MAKPDLFRILGCVALLTLIFVIAVKMSKQCMRIPASGSPATATATASPSAKGACKAGFTVNEHGFCVEAY
jgi:hypothetical protein